MWMFLSKNIIFKKSGGLLESHPNEYPNDCNFLCSKISCKTQKKLRISIIKKSHISLKYLNEQVRVVSSLDLQVTKETFAILLDILANTCYKTSLNIAAKPRSDSLFLYWVIFLKFSYYMNWRMLVMIKLAYVEKNCVNYASKVIMTWKKSSSTKSARSKNL